MSSHVDLVTAFPLNNAVTVFQIVPMIPMNMTAYNVDQVSLIPVTPKERPLAYENHFYAIM